MNSITIDGTVFSDAKMELLKEADGKETPMMKFIMMDTGVPFSRKKSLFIEVNFKKEAATSIFPYMKVGKPVIVRGELSTKGTKEPRYYIAADIVKYIEPKGEAK
ncbi:MAG: hypothetical protein J5647_03765 [Spirochaetaceae bacterium]|nr:hypothetical protein [Spirochaetaceae bacterium]